jgi:glycosyltransferase involved in cell wall biosynthesis
VSAVISNRLSVIIIANNEEENIVRCLKSVAWADEIIVVDSMSTDSTVEKSLAFGARAVRNEWHGYARQKAFALSLATSHWVLSLDADEEVSVELRDEIRSRLQANSVENGFQIPRKSYFLGQWMKHGGWWPGYQLRLFRRERTTMPDRPVHEGFAVAGNVGKLENALEHYSYRSLHHYIEKLNDYTSLDVMNKIDSSFNRRVRWYNFILNPFSMFFRSYISLGGRRDGFRGFLLAVYSSLSSLLVYAKTWEYQRAVKSGFEKPPVTNEEITTLKQRI